MTLQADKHIDRNSTAFDAWAQVYDSQPNPLLALEERYLECLLPEVDGKDILDAGCGTGRWLRRFANRGCPRSLHGIDSSIEMLALARHSCIRNASLILAQLPAVPLASASIDLALCSFALSYIDDIETLAEELRRVLRDDGDLFVTDIHPDTALVLGWQRGFRSSTTSFRLQYEERSIETILHTMISHDFRVVGLYQPTFGEPEHSIFMDCGKESSYEETAGRPAIYLLHLKPKCMRGGRHSITFANTHFALGSQEMDAGTISIQEDAIASVLSGHTQPLPADQLNLSGYTFFPGLINAHDHLEFGLFPRLGNPPYQNAADWAHDIHQSFRSLIAKHNSVPRDVRIWWGALRNLLCGVTTVCHHNPVYPAFQDPRFPVRVISEFGWAHSLSFSSDLAAIHSLANPSQPFIIHACEGIDTAVRSEFARLLDMNVLDDRAVLVHGLAMSLDEIETLNQRGASLISCPSSNQFLFSRTPSLEQLNAVRQLAIGSDSPLTAKGDLLDEISFCHNQLCLSTDKLFGFVTRTPAAMLSLKNGAGRIMPGGPADVFAVRSSSLSPAKRMVSISWRDVELVVVAGSIRVASSEMMRLLPPDLSNNLSPLCVDGIVRWVDAPVGSLFQAAANVLGADGVSLNSRRISLLGEHYVC